MFTIFKFLHILLMFAAVAATVLPEVVLHLVASSRDVRAIRTFGLVVERVGKVSTALFVGGIAFGLLAAWSGEFNFLAPWLVATYVLVAAATVIGVTVTDRWAARLTALAGAVQGDRPSPELEGAIVNRGARIASAVLMATLATIIFLMVFKPGT